MSNSRALKYLLSSLESLSADMVRCVTLLALALGLGLGLGLKQHLDEPRATKNKGPNVLVIMSDDQGT